MNTEGPATSSENQSEWPRIAIIVLNWNNYEDTAKCIKNLESIEYPNFRVFVVDNGSTDGSGKRLSQDFDWCEYIFNDQNLGFAGGVNVGIKESLQNETDHILLLNNDAYPKNNFLKHMIQTLQKNKNVAVVGGMMYNTSGEIEWAGAKISKYTMTSDIYDEPKNQQSCYPTDWVNGGAMLLNGKFLNEAGYLDDSYFFGMEDVEISLRAQSLGWKVIVEPKAKIYHKVGSTAGSANPFRYYHSTRNRLSIIKNHLDGLENYTALAFFLISRIVRILQWMVFNDSPIDKSRAILTGMIDYWKKRPPKKPKYFDHL